MGKPIGLGPRLVAIQQAGITKEEAGKQLQAQAAAGVPPAEMVFVNPKTQVTVPANMEQGSAPTTVQSMATAPTAVQVAMTSAQTRRHNFLGFDITDLVESWNAFWKTMGLGYKTNQWDGLTPKYKTNQFDGTIDELEKGR